MGTLTFLPEFSAGARAVRVGIKVYVEGRHIVLEGTALRKLIKTISIVELIPFFTIVKGLV